MTAMSNSGPTLNRSFPVHMYPGDQKSERDPEFRTRPETRFLKKFLPQSNDRKRPVQMYPREFSFGAHSHAVRRKSRDTLTP